MVPAIIGAVFGVLLFCVILFFTYPWKIHPSSEYRDADRIVDFCLANGILVHGHTLNWYMQVPEWWFKGSGRN